MDALPKKSGWERGVDSSVRRHEAVASLIVVREREVRARTAFA